MEVKESCTVIIPKNSKRDDIEKMERILFAIWGDGQDNDMVKFSPFVSFFGIDDEADYTNNMTFRMGHICQAFFEHQKRPTKMQLKKVAALLLQIGCVQVIELRVGNVIKRNSIQFIKYAWIRETTKNRNIDFDDPEPEDYVQIAFFKPFFERRFSFINNN